VIQKSIVYILIIVLVFVFVCQKQADKEQAEVSNEQIFNENADAQADIDAAILRAKVNGKHVLLMFGGNWCSWSQRLYKLFNENDEVKKALYDNYELVMVDLGKRDKNMDIDEKYGFPNTLGLPALVVLDADGEQIHTQETGILEYPDDHTPKGHDPILVLDFLMEWAPKDGN